MSAKENLCFIVMSDLGPDIKKYTVAIFLCYPVRCQIIFVIASEYLFLNSFKKSNFDISKLKFISNY